ncbi:MAG: helix-hairpin-helix domain-containing protein, partial [Actinomycetota bacterium]
IPDVTSLTANDLVADSADLYALTVERLVELDRVGEKSAQNLVDEITASKERPLPRLLTALGIRHLGPAASAALTAEFHTLDAILEATPEELAAVDGVGGVIATTLRSWLDLDANRAFLEKLRDAGVSFGDPEAAARAAEARASTPQTLEGKAVVVSGTLEGYSRDEAAEAITSRGGKSPGSVSGKTFALVVGESPGASKVTKAEAAGVPIVNGVDFERLLETGEIPG